MKKKIYVVGSNTHYASWIDEAEIVGNAESADIVLFTGGEDVSPSLYGCEKHKSTFTNEKRDLEEQKIFKKIKPNQVCLGICRGSQFLCVMNGGRLVQDISGHAIRGTHTILTGDDMEYEITSTHHQMQYPYCIDPKKYSLIAVASMSDSPHCPISDYYEGDKINVDPIMCLGEPEIVLYHLQNKPKCLAIQGHPEMMRKEAPVISYLNSLIDSVLNGVTIKELNNVLPDATAYKTKRARFEAAFRP